MIEFLINGFALIGFIVTISFLGMLGWLMTQEDSD
jgi:hypothetical protein